jgi:hypothetical protein
MVASLSNRARSVDGAPGIRDLGLNIGDRADRTWTASDSRWPSSSKQSRVPRMPQGPRTSHAAYRMLVATGMGALGFIAGGYAGAAMEGRDCGCDSPGLKGFLIGAPVGAAVGATFGALITR